jgi:putative salt-induced outer membrane protein YdiY
MRNVIAAGLLLATGLSRPAAADDPTKPMGWGATANLSGVSTSGNTSTRSFGGKLRVDRFGERTLFFFEGGGIYQSDKEGDIFAVGTPDAFVVRDERESVKKAERYYSELGLERKLGQKFFASLGGGWKRDLFAGIERQVSLRGGVGYAHVTPEREFKLGALVTFTDQKDLVEDPDLQNPFVGGRLTAEYLRKFGEGLRNKFSSRFALDQNFETSEDTRILWDNALTVTMTRRLALQVGYILNWRNLPAFEDVPLFPEDPPEGPPTGSVLRRLDSLDQTFQVSLVISWPPRQVPVAKPNP